MEMALGMMFGSPENNEQTALEGGSWKTNAFSLGGARELICCPFKLAQKMKRGPRSM